MTTTHTFPDATTPTGPRINYIKLGMDAIQGWYRVEEYVKHTTLPHDLLHLVKLRASQINGCAFCIDMHSADAFKLGVSPTKLLLLDAWEESPGFSAQERAALAWTDAVTRISDTHASDDVYEKVRPYFTEEEFVALTVAIAQINAWNRVAISLRSQPASLAKSAAA